MNKNTPSWNEVRIAKNKVLKSYRALIDSIKDLGDLIQYSDSWLAARVLPYKKFDRLKTAHIRAFFKSAEQEMKDRLVELEKRSEAQAKKKQLMDQFSLSEEDVIKLIETLKNP